MIRKLLVFLALVAAVLCSPRAASAQGTVQAATCYQGTTSAWTAYFLNSVFVYPLCNSSGAEVVTLSAGSSSAPQYVIGEDKTTAANQWSITAGGALSTEITNGGGAVASMFSDAATATATGNNILGVASFGKLYNGTQNEAWRTAAGVTGGSAPAGVGAMAPCNGASSTANCASVLYNALLTMTGGTTTATVAAASAGPNVIKASAGRLSRVVITTAGTTGTDIFYDNASACSGTIIAEIAGTTASAINVAGGVPFQFDMPAANGITECGGTGSAAVTVSYY